MELELNRVEAPFVFEVSNGKSVCTIDANKEIGGKEKGLRPMELVASGLAGCIAIDLIRVLEKQRISSDLFRISINAERKEDVLAPFKYINLTFELDDSLDRDKISKNIELIKEKYCSVAASLDKEININCVVK